MRFIFTLPLFLSTLGVLAQTTCVDPLACNFTEFGECEFLDDNGFPCVTEGCAITGACNFDPEADINDGSCEFTSCLGCTDEAACNYDSEAVYLDLSCIYFVDCNGVCGGDWIEDECGNCFQIILGFAGSVEFSYSGAEQTFVVPVGVNSVQVECWGASGGDGNNLSQQPGGGGGYAAGTLSVTPGETLSLFVGGEGTRSNISPIAGGFNGGGEAYNYGNVSWYCAGGGGATDVRVGGTTLEDRVLVAGGGGGGGGSGSHAYGGGGDGGGIVGDNGFDTEFGNDPYGDRHGKGGSQSAGGPGGTSESPGGSDGVFGIGGDASIGSNALASGGGGGYYGGGGGSYHGGAGGGGSSYVGGVTDAVTISGVNSGDGLIVISWVGPTQPLCLLGCAVPQACNFNPEATNDDGSCDFCFCGPGTEYSIDEGQCLVVGGGSDINGDGCTNLNDLLDLLAGYGSCID